MSIITHVRPMIDQAFFDFINEIESVRKELRCSNSGAFYRGHTHTTHMLIPSLLRSNFSSEKENNLYADSFARGRHLIKDYRNSWEFLSIMQHYGIPTRLLDWTESLSTALFFALTEPGSDPKIWIINGYELNRTNKVTKVPGIPVVGLEPIPDYEDYFINIENNQPWPFTKPIFIQIPWGNERIVNQKGFFTVHPNTEPMEMSCKKHVRGVTLKKEAIPGAIRFLEYAGVSEHTIFPDLQGFGMYLKKINKV